MGNVWDVFGMWLIEAQAQTSITQVSPRLQGVVMGLLLLVGLMVLVEDWRALVVMAAGVGVTVAILLVPLLPRPWALSRMVAAGVGGTLLWLGARRRPHRPLRVESGVWVRLPVLVFVGLALWQAQPYFLQVWPNPIYINGVAGLVLGGVGLIALGGDVIRSTLAAQMWVHAAFFLLAWWQVPTSWVPFLTVLDVGLAATGGMIAAGEGVWMRWGSPDQEDELATVRERGEVSW